MNVLSATVYEYTRLFRNQKRKGLLLNLKGKENQESWGEIAPLDSFSNESFEQVTEELLEELPYLLCGQWHPQNLSPSVHFGIESAILDLILPIFPNPISVNALLTGSPDEIYTQAKKLRNYKAVKVKVGDFSVQTSISLVTDLLNIFPQGMQIRIDANRKWTYEEGMQFAQSFTPTTFEYFEEPFTSPKEYASFPYPIALDETVQENSHHSLLSFPYLRAFIIKPTLIGGCTKLVPLLKQANKKDIDFILSSSYESELGISIIAKVASRLQLPMVPMGLDTSCLFKDQLFEENVKYDCGKLTFPKNWKLTMGSVIAHECI